MQTYTSPASRNTIEAAGGVEPGKVPTPEKQGSPTAPAAPGNAHTPGSKVTGFSGGLMPGKC